MSLLAVTIDSREPDWVQRLAFGDSTPVSVGVIEHGDLLAVCDDDVCWCYYCWCWCWCRCWCCYCCIIDQ